MKLKQLIKRAGHLELFELKKASITCLILSPSIIIYSLLIYKTNPNPIEIPWARELFSISFLIIGLLPYTKRKFVLNNYGWFIFGILLMFSHYLIYTTYYNNFSLDYLLGSYITIFGSILLLKDKVHIILFNASCLIHILLKVQSSNLVNYEGYAILISMSTIFIFSFIILNDAIQYKERLIRNNIELEKKVKLRTIDLEKRTKKLLKKNEELEEYAYVISHDLKSPIRNIHAITQWVLDDNKNIINNQSKENLNLIKDLSTQMDLLVSGILDYSLKDKTEANKEFIDLNQMLNSLAKSNQDCEIILKSTFPVINEIKHQVIQIFQNLIQNGIKYNDKEKKIIIIDYKLKDNYHQFSIEDNGIGIDEKYFDKIFRLFQKLNNDNQKNSIGLGLSLVKKIIQSMGGEIWLTSTLNKGSTFYFTIPVS